jgi:hypothetical protein
MDDITWAFIHTKSTPHTLFRIDLRQVIFNVDGTERADTLAAAKAETSKGTGL